MDPNIIKATYLSDYLIHITFDDGKSGPVDLRDELWGEIFTPLKDLKQFKYAGPMLLVTSALPASIVRKALELYKKCRA